MLRRSFSIAAVVSTLLLVLTLVMWVMSYSRWPYNQLLLHKKPVTVGIHTANEGVTLENRRGRLSIYRVTLTPIHSPDFSAVAFDPNVTVPVSVRHWQLAIGFAVLPMVWLIRWLRRSRFAAPGACKVCGYDLRARPSVAPSAEQRGP